MQVDTIGAIGFTEDDFKIIHEGLDYLKKQKDYDEKESKRMLYELKGMPSFLSNTLREMVNKDNKDGQDFSDKVVTIQYKLVEFKRLLNERKDSPGTPVSGN
jgi:hypothetical protein